MQKSDLIRAYPHFEGARGPLTESDKLVFLHFEKTAGTTVSDILQNFFDSSKIFPERSGVVRYWPNSYLENYRLFLLHASMNDIINIPKPLKVITFLRDPVERLTSLYRYWASFKDSAINTGNLTFPRYAKSVSFTQFLSQKSVRIIPTIWNIYTQHLAGDHAFSPSGRVWDSEDALLDAASKNIEKFSFVGIVESMESSLREMHRELGLGTYESEIRKNVTTNLHIIDPITYNPPPDIVIDDEGYERLHEVTRLDRIIYDQIVRQRPEWKRSEGRYTLRFDLGGELVNDSGQDWIVPKRTDEFMLYGPYVPLAAGKYLVRFHLKSRSSNTCKRKAGIFDVVMQGGKTVISQHVLHSGSQQDDDVVELEFSLSRPAGDVEFRAHPNGDAGFIVSPQITLLRL